jgi:hypothetical protein
MKFNMGCGLHKSPGFINVDASAACVPDQVWNLEETPWPWPDACATHVAFIHSLEHMGATTDVFLQIIREIYRIAKPGCWLTIHAPHPRHDNFIGDPTHVRPITPKMLELFDREKCDAWAAAGHSNTPLALYLGVDFVMVEASTELEEPWRSRRENGSLSDADLDFALRTYSNVATEHRIRLCARK